MKVIYIDDKTARTDGRRGKPSGVTISKVYTVVEVLDDKYTVMNDDNKLARYAKERFQVTDNSPVPSLREAFNTLTLPIRQELKQLKKTADEWEEFGRLASKFGFDLPGVN